ncbi:MAG: phosphatidylserine decarboxylase [Woeseiaceae bacterium]|nr:phosphatidylserine decarboxylase [Woeseiaceae bacterium]
MTGRLFVLLQRILPRHWLTAIIYRIARIRTGFIKDALIRGFVRLYKVDVAEIEREIPADFPTFNDFFTRELAPGARTVDTAKNSIISPVDGTVSAAKAIRNDNLFQAKGLEYSLDELLALDLDRAHAFDDGIFTTIYLAPYNYHRVHMPLDAELVSAHYVPGDLFSVNETTVGLVDGLFHRNERLNLHFDTAVGPVALIFVGALNVGSITTPWTGEIRPRKKGMVETRKLGRASRSLKKGDLLGWFNMGSTVILLLPANTASWNDTLVAGATVRMGEPVGSLLGNAK